MKGKKSKASVGKVILIVALILIAGVVTLVKTALNKIKAGAEVSELTAERQTGVWYKFTPVGAIDSIGEQWHGLIRFGTENKTVINFYGGGVSVNEDTAKEGDDFYFHTIGNQDWAQLMGISAYDDKNPLKDWTFINVPYCTGDWHIGADDFEYADKTGGRSVLHHHGYANFKLMMAMIAEYVKDSESVLVTGWSGGGFGASFLAEEIFTDYFPNARNKAVLADAAFLLKSDWKEIAENVWGTPERIASRFTSDNLVLDSLRSLSANVPDAKILFLCSIRDEALTKYQNYLNTGVFQADEAAGKEFEKNLKIMVDELLTFPNASVFIWNDKGNDTELTTHTVTMIQFVGAEYGGVKVSDWLINSINGDMTSYGVELFSPELLTNPLYQDQKIDMGRN